MLERMELKHIKKSAHLKLKNKLCNKICARKDKRRTYQVKCKLASCNAHCRLYNYYEEQHWYIDRDCNHDHAYDNKR
jgi:hypothetical protein